MAFDPEEHVTLTNHGSMRLRSAVARAMTLPLDERKTATIVRKGKPATLRYERIRKSCSSVGGRARALRMSPAGPKRLPATFLRFTC